MSARENIERVEWTMQDPAWVPSRDYLAKVLAAYKEAAAEIEEVAAFLDALADRLDVVPEEVDQATAAAECREMAKRLRGE